MKNAVASGYVVNRVATTNGLNIFQQILTSYNNVNFRRWFIIIIIIIIIFYLDVE